MTVHRPAPPAGDSLADLPAAIEDYALIGNGRTAALVSRAGSIDWLCWPRFDAPACFAALLGSAAHGRWRLGPVDPPRAVSRRYLPDSLVLETCFQTATGRLTLTDFMPRGADAVVRLLAVPAGTVDVAADLAPRFGYGAEAPVIASVDRGAGLRLTGADSVLTLTADGVDPAARRFTLRQGQQVAFTLWHGTAAAAPLPAVAQSVSESIAESAAWSDRGIYRGPHAAAVRRSLLTLRALIHAPTGAMVAAPTASLPEQPGGSRNWDYRYCWLRDSSLAARTLLRAGHAAEAVAWADWLCRSVAPAAMRTLYGVAGAPPAERELDWLPGYHGARPVRVGNAASEQLQIDVFGELLDTLLALLRAGLLAPSAAAPLIQGLMARLEAVWALPDDSIWEVRGPARHFTLSKVMAWVAFDRAIQAAEAFGLPAPLARWRSLRARIHRLVCTHGFDPRRGSFTQSLGGLGTATDAPAVLDASLLLIPLTGFLPPDDPRVAGTVAAIGESLTVGGLIRRYHTAQTDDGLSGGEGVFLACSFWYVQALAMLGRVEAASALFTRLLGLSNDLGLLAEEYDPAAGRMLGNFPQAFSHLALVDAAFALQAAGGGG